MLQRPAQEREDLAERVARRLDAPLTAAGVVFALLVLADTVIRPGPSVARVFEALSWALWAVFVGEYVLRLTIAPSWARYLRRTWWQLLFLAVPFFRFLRPLARLRVPRLGRIVSAALRSVRVAGRRLTSRVAWLATTTVIVVLASSQALYAVGAYDRYAEALHGAALATITGEPLGVDDGLARILEVVLAIYSVVVFAALAGMLGAFFVEAGAQARAGASGRSRGD